MVAMSARTEVCLGPRQESVTGAGAVELEELLTLFDTLLEQKTGKPILTCTLPLTLSLIVGRMLPLPLTLSLTIGRMLPPTPDPVLNSRSHSPP